jgi:hypothetical protein
MMKVTLVLTPWYPWKELLGGINYKSMGNGKKCTSIHLKEVQTMSLSTFSWVLEWTLLWSKTMAMGGWIVVDELHD